MAHFDAKAEVEEHVLSLGIPATFFYAGVYMSNFPGQLQKVEIKTEIIFGEPLIILRVMMAITSH